MVLLRFLQADCGTMRDDPNTQAMLKRVECHKQAGKLEDQAIQHAVNREVCHSEGSQYRSRGGTAGSGAWRPCGRSAGYNKCKSHALY